ncbi:MAG TPA: hypothetical protein VFA91_11980 [Candidatus Polarisedimenticolia bacterium]|nr:hypothetical protein [Candidatus Polarisedimenticolia bacterium]
MTISPQSARYLIFVVIGFGLVAVSLWEIARALKTGRLRLRISSITRESHPGLFWFDVAACGVTAVLGALFGAHFLLAVLGSS